MCIRDRSNGGSGAVQNNLSAGSYTVTVSDGEGCTDTAVVTVGTSESPTVTVSSVDTSCGEQNGSVSASATGGVGGYTYEWNTGESGSDVSNLSVGTYTVTVTDAAGCTDVDSVAVGSSESPTLNVSSSNTTCGENNGSASVIATGGVAPYAYLWSCLLYTSPSPRDGATSRMPSSA